MKSTKNLGNYSSTSVLLADDILEFHAARLLLLLQICGINGKIDGLTKLAKLDFFVRYPEFFNIVSKKLGARTKSTKAMIESKMVRFHYGPWDHRYYHVLGFLKAAELINYDKKGQKVVISITPKGSISASRLINVGAYIDLISQMKQVSELLGKKKGTELKDLIYEVFNEEVAKRELGEVIE